MDGDAETVPNHAEPPDALLISRALSDDLQAFEALYRKHSARVYGLCIRLVRNEADAQDCTQETFIRAWRQLATFRGHSAFGTWLHRIAVNEILSRRRRKATEERYLEIVQPETTAPDREGDFDIEVVERAIARLPERARDVFVLHRIYGYTHEETAQMLDIASGTCKAHVYRASKLLLRMLEAGGTGSAERRESGY